MRNFSTTTLYTENKCNKRNFLIDSISYHEKLSVTFGLKLHLKNGFNCLKLFVSYTCYT
jgi:hypothetical protein